MSVVKEIYGSLAADAVAFCTTIQPASGNPRCSAAPALLSLRKCGSWVWVVMMRGDGYRAKQVLGHPAWSPQARSACEGEEDVMASGRAADREDPSNSRRNEARSLDWDPISELHQGQQSYAPHRRAGHMTAPDHIARTAAKTLARGGRPHMVLYGSARSFHTTQLYSDKPLSRTGN